MKVSNIMTMISNRRGAFRRGQRRRLREYEERRRQQHRTTYLLLCTVVFACTVERNVWMKQRSGHFWDRIVEGEFTARDFRENFRVNKCTFDFLCDERAPAISRQDTRWRNAVCVKKRLAITLWRLSTNCEYRTIGHLFGVARCTANVIVNETCRVIVEELMTKYITFPSGDRLRATVEGFDHDMGFPQVAGAIDGTHIPIIAPVEFHADYHNRKGWYSVILQAVCDNNYLFTDIMVGWPGRCHDARVLANSSFHRRAENGELLPNVTRNINGQDVPLMILGDPAYPLLPWLMKGFSDNGRLTDGQINFNYRLSRARMVIEGCFGRLKGRWRCLLKRNDSALENITNIVGACCTLHNICQMQSDEPDDEWLGVARELQEFQPPPRALPNQRPAAPSASAVRDALVQYFH